MDEQEATINWHDLSIEERDRLASEKLGLWKPGVECDGAIGTTPSDDGYYCMKCGYRGEWWDWDVNEPHHQEPPRLSQDIGAAWALVERFRLVVRPTILGYWCAGVFESVTLSNLTRLREGTFAEARTAPEAICLAALKTIGVAIRNRPLSDIAVMGPNANA